MKAGNHSNWSPSRSKAALEKLTSFDPSPFIGITAAVTSIDCKSGGMPAARFDNNRIAGDLCVYSFESQQLNESPVPVESVRDLLSLNGTSVGGNTYLSIWPKDAESGIERKANPVPPVLDIRGYQTGGLVVPFAKDSDKPLRLLATGIRFDRIFDGDLNCNNERTDAPDWGSAPLLDAGMRLPDSQQLLHWLAHAESSQPYAATIAAIQRVGADATELKIGMAQVEWDNDRAAKWEQIARGWEEKTSLKFLSALWPNTLDYAKLIFGRLLGFLADYGYRPQKAFVFIAISVVAFTLWISRGLKVKSALSEVQDRKISVGWLFVLDHMIPGYNIDEGHFKIREFRFANERCIDDNTKMRLYRTLRWIKVTGAIATIFVAAALKTLVVG